MGIGEDPETIEEISVTVIATGFDIKLQDEIIHIDPKKKIHYLENEGEVIEKFDKNKNKTTLQFENASDSIDFKNINFNSEKISYSDTKTETFELDDIKDLDVEFESVSFDNSNVDDEKIEVDVKSIVVNEPELIKYEINELNFHNTVNSSDDIVVHTLEDDINDIIVIDPVQIIPYTMVADSQSIKVADEVNSNLEKDKSNDDLNPFNNPIAKALAKRTEERKIKLKEFNYKFAKARRVLDMEKEPAYKRAGIELESDIISNDISATKIEEDNDGNLELKSNNSFLHDNVD